jgi:gas vesicle protein
MQNNPSHYSDPADDGLTSFLIGLSFGLFAGAVTALLTTPKSGDELVHGVSQVFRELPDRVNDELVQSGTKTRELLDKTRQSIENQIDRTRKDRSADRMARAKQAEELASGYEFN